MWRCVRTNKSADWVSELINIDSYSTDRLRKLLDTLFVWYQLTVAMICYPDTTNRVKSFPISENTNANSSYRGAACGK